MQIAASASQWTNHTTRVLAASLAALSGAALYVRMRVAISVNPGPVTTTVIVDVSADGEGWIPLQTFTHAGAPKFLGLGASALRPTTIPATPVQGGSYAIEYIRAYENPPIANPQLSTSGGSQQIG